MNNLAKVIALGGRRLNKALAMHYLFAEQGIPKGYIPLAYIESTGTQWINTGVILTEYTYDGNLMFTEVPAAGIATVFGAQLSAAPWNEKSVTVQNGKWRLYAYRGAVSVGGTVVANKDYHISGQHKSGDIRLTVNRGLDDEINVTNTASYNVNDNPIGIFAMYNSGNGVMRAKIRLYNLSFSTFDGELVRDYRPCISPDGEVGLYDLVDRKFYGNNGTGAFIAGYSVDNYVTDKIISFTDAEWGLDGTTLKNLVGDNYDMSITGSLPYADKGLTFNGTTDNYINVPEFTELANTAEVTCEMAMNLTNIQGTQRLLYLKDFFEFFVRKGKINSDLHLDGEPRENLQGDANTGFITFAAVFKANSYQRLFINGVQVASTSAVSPSSVPASGTIGGSGYAISGGSKFYNMRVYNRALTAEELAQNYEIDQSRFGLTETASVMMLDKEEEGTIALEDEISTISYDEATYTE